MRTLRRSVPSRSLVLTIAACSLGCSGSGSDSPRDASVARVGEPVLGTVGLESDCVGAEPAFLGQAIQLGRESAVSSAFSECVDRAMRSGVLISQSGVDPRNQHEYVPYAYWTPFIGPYRACHGRDPFEGAPIDSQVLAAMHAARGPNDFDISCHGGAGYAETYGTDSWGASDAEDFSFARSWLDRWQSYSGFGFDGFPQTAHTVWHEAMHSRGYDHDTMGSDPSYCGYALTNADDFLRYSVNEIVGRCMEYTLVRSAQRCGDPRDGCRTGEARLLDHMDGTTCSCVHDPRPTVRGMGLLAIDPARPSFDTAFGARAMVDNGASLGGWRYGRDNQVVAVGNFDGVPGDEVLLRSPWGIGVLTLRGTEPSTLTLAPYGTNLGGWQLSASDRFVGTGDLDGDGHDEIIIESREDGAGYFGVLTLRAGGLSPLIPILGPPPSGAARIVRAIADVDGDGRSDLVVHDGLSQYSVMALRGASLTAIGTIWDTSAHTNVMVGNVDGWLGSEIIVTDDSAVWIYSMDGGALTSWARIASGATIPSREWASSATFGFAGKGSDEIVAVGDLDGDGTDDLVIYQPRTQTYFAVRWFPTWGLPILFDVVDWMTVPGTYRVRGVGPIDAHPGDEVLLDGTGGLLALALSGNETGARPAVLPGQFAGSWRFDAGHAANALVDGDGDRRMELLMTTSDATMTWPAGPNGLAFRRRLH